MSLCPDNPIRGNHLTDNFTFDEVNKQVVPKPGTDTKPGALALNLGNAAGDTTNATDALTAAGFNTMANAVDGTAPLCGNEIQQAVTAAVAQSIACDADAQEAIACAIASNPEAVACLSAVLGGSTTSGKYYVVKGSPSNLGDSGPTQIFKIDNGVVTNLTPAGLPMVTRPDKNQVPLAMNTDKPVAYLGELVDASASTILNKIHQQTITDSGVTDTVFDLTTLTNKVMDVEQSAFYRNGALYVVVSEDLNYPTPRAIWKLTLNAQGLITGGSEVVSNAFTFVFDIQGDYALCQNYNGNGSFRIVNLITEVDTQIPGQTNNSTRNGCLSPDGTKFFLFSTNAGDSIQTGLTSDGVVLTVFAQEPYVNGGYGFVSADNSRLIVNGYRSNFGSPTIHDATTLATYPTQMLTWPSGNHSAGIWEDATHSIVPSNNAIGYTKGLNEFHLFEDKGGVWTQVASVTATGSISGIHRVVA